MENRNGLCADFTIHAPIAEPESVVALQQVSAHEALHEGAQVKTLWADKGYPRKAFVAQCREQGIAPHVACKEGIQVPGLDGRTTAQESYRLSQRIRKRVEEIFGWLKTVRGLRRSRYRGRERTQRLGPLCRGHLQSAADGAPGTGPRALSGPRPANSPGQQRQSAAAQGEFADTGTLNRQNSGCDNTRDAISQSPERVGAQNTLCSTVC
jgi:hypothetical protein